MIFNLFCRGPLKSLKGNGVEQWFPIRKEFYTCRGGISTFDCLPIKNYTLFNFAAFCREFVFQVFDDLSCVAM